MKLQLSNAQVGSEWKREVERRVGRKMADCYQCGKCSAGCPTAYEMFHPIHAMVRLVQLGRKEAALQSRSQWVCVACEACSTRCPKDVDPARLMTVLREMAQEEGCVNANESDIYDFHRSFLASVRMFGRVYEMGLVASYKMKSPLRRGFQDLVTALHMRKRGKPGFLWHKVQNVAAIRRIYDRTKLQRPADRNPD
ncbi:MAG: 4Fe-4S dicluster domain-containing protein [Candidatus Brocadiae bacterium]|nr:4Fe-4S dicluster domain-containing protein [Candidatus Brocadiia bacterium]